MTLRERITPFITRRVLDPARRDKARARAEAARRKAGAPHRVVYFHQLDDPYSALAAQMLAPFAARYDIALEVMLVPPPAAQDAPQRAALENYARRDAATIGPAYGLAFRDPGCQPGSDLVERANAVALAAIRAGRFVALAPEIDAALWAGDAAALGAMAADLPQVSAADVAAALEEGRRMRARMGHYLGAAFCYGGEQYWGIDRLHHLERRLAALGADRARGESPPLTEPPALFDDPVPPGEGPEIDFFLSLRSPYTAVVAARFFALAERYNCPVRLRFVLPMMMRGIPASREKQRYILIDAKREAERLGVPFGPVADPFGTPSERGLSLIPHAIEKGRGKEFVLSFLSGCWAEAIPAGSDRGLRRIVERAGLDWGAARRELDNTAWREEAEANRQALFGHGLWGVPSFSVGGNPAWWGQDRLWLVEREIRAARGLSVPSFASGDRAAPAPAAGPAAR